MRIPYTTRSKFFEPIRAALQSGRDTLSTGEAVRCQLRDPGGYSGELEIAILEEDGSLFNSTWEGADWTRFPARIRAAATVLRELGYRGKFQISHQDGLLKITSV